MTAFNKSPEGRFVQVSFRSWSGHGGSTFRLPGEDRVQATARGFHDSDARLWDETAKAVE
jgi:hypothetical protein